MSFVSGLDICDGRYDTGKYSSFDILKIESHCFEFDQINISGDSLHKGGLREPWHACITGDWMVKFTVKLTDPPPALEEANASPPPSVLSMKDAFCLCIAGEVDPPLALEEASSITHKLHSITQQGERL
ncbi:hypothetical protein LWI28_021236 [Acer negundo]|uniref:Uncharacterized protein n=1 Tax=Acer negundo TaxID=4023 RepID=A0AAD5NK23_ACENE|nr:hypothetical protein LWI28_021236 [Acer negundo]